MTSVTLGHRELRPTSLTAHKREIHALPTENSTAAEFGLSARARRAHAQPISYLMAQAVANPTLISLAAGLVDYQTLPGPETLAILTQLLGRERTAQIALQYGTTEGLATLRQTLLEHIAALDGVEPDDYHATVDDIVITTGSQQLLFILTDVLVEPGDIVITEWPSYFVYTSLLELFGAQVRCVEMDENGLIPAKLDALLGEIAQAGLLPRVKIVYTCDYHQNPTGITLSAERRPQVLDVVRKYSIDHRILLLEDAAYRELTYRGQAPPSIKSYDTGNEFVALAQTFSKPFAPGLRTGYGLLPRDLMPAVVAQKGSHDFGCANLAQHLLLEAMRQGLYAAHVQKLCETYAIKCDAMQRALEAHLGSFEPAQTRWTHPWGGLYVYLTLPPRITTGPGGVLLARAIEEGVLYVPGEYCYAPDPQRTIPLSTMRLTFGTATVEQIHEGIARLGRAIRAV